MKKCKRIIAAFISAAIAMCLPVMHMHADDTIIISSDDSRYKYIENADGSIYIAASEYSQVGLSGEVVIPSELDGRPVTGICKSGFTGTAITEITIPDSVKEIEPLAFANCLNLAAVNLPDSITKVGEIAFSNTVFETNLLKNSDPEFVILNDYILYLYTGHQRDVAVPDGIRVIANSAFANNTDIASITLPDSVEYLGDNAFEKCDNLKKIVIKTGVKSIGSNAIKSGEDVIIYGYSGSYAESFAKENENPFVAIVKPGQSQIECEYDEDFKQYYFSTDTEFSKKGIHIYERYEDGSRIEITDQIDWNFSSTPKELFDKANNKDQ